MATANLNAMFCENEDDTWLSYWGITVQEMYDENAHTIQDMIDEWYNFLYTSLSLTGSSTITFDMQPFLTSILSQSAIDASHCIVGIRTINCTAKYRAFRYVDLTDFTSDTVSVDVWYSDIHRSLTIDGASLVYMGDPVSDENRVPTGQSFIISVGLTEQEEKQEPLRVPVTVNAYCIPDSSSLAVFGMPTADAAQQRFGILQGAPNMRTMYEAVLSAGQPAYFASEEYQPAASDTDLDIRGTLSKLFQQDTSAHLSAALAFNWSDSGTVGIGSYNDGSIKFDTGELANNASRFEAVPVELLFC